MVNAEAAGVMFTADPVTGDDTAITINAAWGLGEAVVGGEVTPDHRGSRSDAVPRWPGAGPGRIVPATASAGPRR